MRACRIEPLSPSVMGWLGRFSGLASDLAEHFQLDEAEVREFVMHQGRAAIVDFVRWELGDGDGEPATGSDERDR